MAKKDKVPVKPRIDGVDITSFTYDQLLSFVIAVGEELEQTRKDTQDFRSDTYKVNKYWQLTQNQIEDCGQEVHRLNSNMIDQKLDEEKLIFGLEQRLRRALYDTGVTKNDLMVQYAKNLIYQREGLDDAEKQMETDVQGIAESMETMKIDFRGVEYCQLMEKVKNKMKAVEHHFISVLSRAEMFDESLREHTEMLENEANQTMNRLVSIKQKEVSNSTAENALERKNIKDVYDTVLSHNFFKIKHLKEDINSKLQIEVGISSLYKKLLEENSIIKKTIQQSKTKTSGGFRQTSKSDNSKKALSIKAAELKKLRVSLHYLNIEKYQIIADHEMLKKRMNEHIAAFKELCVSLQKQAMQEEIISEELKNIIMSRMTERKLLLNLIRKSTKGKTIVPDNMSEVDDNMNAFIARQKTATKFLQIQLEVAIKVYESLVGLYKRNTRTNDYYGIYGLLGKGDDAITI